MKQHVNPIRQRPDKIPVACLRSASYDVIEFYKNHQAVESALGLDLSSTIDLAKALPLGLRDTEHREMRLELAKVLAEGKKRLFPELPQLVDRHFAALTQAGRHDLLEMACKPFVNDCMELLSGIKLKTDQFANLSDIFDPGVSVSKRLRLEKTTSKLLQDTLTSDSDTHCSTARYALAVAVMGRDALLGSLVFSLYPHFYRLRGKPINAMPFSTVPQDTGVPYVWRESVEPETKGQIYECRLDDLVDGDDKERMKLFGLGQHTCLGKNHTLKIFETLSEFLAANPRVVRSVMAVAVEKHVLKIPESFTIELE